MSRCIVTRTDVDPTGKREESTPELWEGVTRDELIFLTQCEERPRERWPRGLIDRFAELRRNRYRPNAPVLDIEIHYANDDEVEETEETEEEESSETMDEGDDE
jgi:hypothetical protein